MKKIILMVCALFFVSANTNAAVITMDVDNQDAFLDEIVTVSIDLNDVTADFTSFFTGFSFDSSLYDFVAGSFSTDFTLFDDVSFSGLDFADVGGLLSINLIEDFFSVMPVIYGPGSYNIATFQLVAKAPGASTFGIVDTEFFGEGSLDPVLPTLGVTSVAATSVSAPSTLAIFGLALAALVSVRRKA